MCYLIKTSSSRDKLSQKFVAFDQSFLGKSKNEVQNFCCSYRSLFLRRHLRGEESSTASLSVQEFTVVQKGERIHLRLINFLLQMYKQLTGSTVENSRVSLKKNFKERLIRDYLHPHKKINLSNTLNRIRQTNQ